MRSGRNLGKERNDATQLLQYIALTENNAFAPLYALDAKRTSHKTSDEDMYLNLDYEMHMGTKLDYFFFRSSRILQTSEIKLLKNHCEQEKTQILTILMLPLENPRLARYMLTGNRSFFLETHGSLAWLYHCPLVHSPLQTIQKTSVTTRSRYSTRAKSKLLILSHCKHIQRLPYKVVPIEKKTYFNSTWTKKTNGLH